MDIRCFISCFPLAFMSKLLLLADVAANCAAVTQLENDGSQTSSNESAKLDASIPNNELSATKANGSSSSIAKVDACVQTCDLGPRLCSYICDSSGLSGNASSTPLVFYPAPSAVHDYVKQSEADLVVNATHDYYSRTWASEEDLEHSYAVHVQAKAENGDKGTGRRPIFVPILTLHPALDPQLVLIRGYFYLYSGGDRPSPHLCTYPCSPLPSFYPLVLIRGYFYL